MAAADERPTTDSGDKRPLDAPNPWLTRWVRARGLLLAIAAVFLLLVAAGVLDAAFAFLAAFVLCAAALSFAGQPAGDDPARSVQADQRTAAARKALGPGAGIAVIDQLPEPLLLLDGTGRVLLCNAAAEPFLTAGPVGKPVAAVLRVPALLEAIDEVLSGADERSIEYRLPVPVERYYQAVIKRMSAPFVAPGVPPASPRSSPPFDGGESVLVLLHDATAAKRVEQMRADFVANASHELKTPLASLSGFIDTLRGHAKDDAEAQERFLDIMADQAGRMRRLIDDLLSLSRIELKEHVRPQETVRIDDVIRDVVDGLAPLAQDYDVDVAVNADEPLPPVRGDRDELAQVFQNLIDNALKYGRAGKRIDIRADLQTDGGRPLAVVAVRDFGPGIATDHLPRLTERFYRVDPAASRERGGTGLGLAIVKHILNRHEGSLAVTSEIGQGSTFTVSLPVLEETSSEP